ncbi:MAG: amylo-alpha-1,6-glucosidase, partial [Bacteroidales bacterium]|nr:amylo-alpha-1,6-glucosidase [Bacteroidales bacterium]
LYACGLPYSPLSEERQASILKVVKTELLTSRGIRTLAPKTPSYKGIYEGDQHERDLASHNGSTRPWLLAIYARANFKLYGESFVRKAQELISGFEEDMTIHGIGAVAEMYDGDPPHNPHGAINSATSTSSILEIIYLINKYKEDTK